MRLDICYLVALGVKVDEHPENATAFAGLVEASAAIAAPVEVHPPSGDSSVVAVWEFDTPEEAQKLTMLLMEQPVCGMMVDLTVSCFWNHGELN